jgi:general secretion pathway protein B
MSMLLDALKKSETQRQLGKTPTIHTAVEAPEAGRWTERRWIAYPLLALSAAAIAWFSWQQYLEPVDALNEAKVDGSGIPQVAETSTPAEPAKKGGKDRVRRPSLWNARNIAARKTGKSSKTSKEQEKRKEELNQSFSAYKVEKDSATGRGKELSSDTLAESSSASTTPLPATENDRVVAQTGSPDPLQPHEPEPISFWQVPQALRDRMPEFKINVLVYADQPEDRFLLINGKRLLEKEELDDGVVLDEIRRDGAVFLYRKYRFLVKG